MIPGSANPLLLKQAAAAGGYQITRSLRFNSADSAYCDKTFTTPTTQNTFTWAGWVKLGVLGTTRRLFGVSTNHSFGFTTGDALNLTFAGSSALTTTALFRDPSAWYHIVWKQSGTSHTIYVNNVSVGTATATSSVFNTAVAHQLGAANTASYFNGYLADIHFIDGQALDPTSFTEVSATTGQLIPKAYTGSFGTNGFWLKFSDNSAATATTLGKDYSGNSNNWTPNNLSVTAGAGNDSLVDTPTSYGTDTGAGGEVRGNFATLSPLEPATVYTSNGNLDFTPTSGSYETVKATCAIGSKCYFEVTVGASNTGQDYPAIGLIRAETMIRSGSTAGYNIPIGDGGNYTGSVAYRPWSGRVVYNGVNQVTGLATCTVNDVIGIAYDPATGQVRVYKNGTALNAGNAVYTLSTSYSYCPAMTEAATNTYYVNFGQRPFAYTAPSGFKALCTANLPAPTIVKGSNVMDVVLYTGNGSTQTISGLGFSPDLVWGKTRSTAGDHHIVDSVRGDASGTSNKTLFPNTTDSELSSLDRLYNFSSSGFVAGGALNTNATTYAAWCWDAGNSTVTNTSGTISSQVRANASAGFSVVTYTGTGGTKTVGHGLGVAPSMLIVKCRSNPDDWAVKHVSLSAGQFLYLNSNSGASTTPDFWNTTNPTSTVFTVAADSHVNGNTLTYVAYCFAPVAGFSAFGSYTGNGSADGPFVYLGFRPALVIVKMSSSTGNWTMLDTKREGYNVDNNPLYPNLSNVEGTADLIDITSNGFKVRTTDATFNTNTGTYVYAAWAENPFSLARAR